MLYSYKVRSGTVVQLCHGVELIYSTVVVVPLDGYEYALCVLCCTRPADLEKLRPARAQGEYSPGHRGTFNVTGPQLAVHLSCRIKGRVWCGTALLISLRPDLVLLILLSYDTVILLSYLGRSHTH